MSSIESIGSRSTTCSMLPLLAAKCGVPVYSAVIVCDPDVSDEVVSDACPPGSTGMSAARIAAPSRKVTVPVVTADPAVTDAVNVTGAPESDGFCDDATDVDVVTVRHDTTLCTTRVVERDAPASGAPP